MRTLDDLLAAVPGLRRRRALNADWLRVLLNRQPKECTWCGENTGKRRLWCSDGCVNAFQMRCCPNTARAFVIRRDGGVCRNCGRDTAKAEADYLKVEAEMRATSGLPSDWRSRDAILDPIKRSFGFARGRWLEVDHDPPVVEGGGLCDPGSLRVLCGVCHAEATKGLAKRRSKQ